MIAGGDGHDVLDIWDDNNMTIDMSAGTVSQAFCLISFSSCPGPQPAYPSATSSRGGPSPRATASRMSLEDVRPTSSATTTVEFHCPSG